METQRIKRINKRKKIVTVTAFLLPAILIYVFFILYPIIANFNYSLFQWNGIEKEKLFIGFDNYINIFKDRSFWLAAKNNIYIVLASVFLQIPLGLVMALVLTANIKGTKLFNIIFFLPYLMSTVAIGLLWIFMFDPLNGPVNQLLSLVGIEPLHWLAGKSTSLIAVLIVMVWQFAPFYMILFRAALVGIPEELYEAAEIDGAHWGNKFLHITLPSLVPTIVTSSILAVVGSLKTFDIFYIMTGGGSTTSTEIMGTYMYRQAFVNFRMGYGSTVASMMFIFALISVVIILYLDFYRKKKRGMQ